jgi:hypothetical protein
LQRVSVGKKPDIVWEVQCWNNRKVILHRQTLLDHVLRFHIESAFVVDELKRNFRQPICVVNNRKNGTVNAIYAIECDGHSWLLVAVKFRTVGTNFIKTFYGVSEIPNGPVIWGNKP